MSKNPYANKKKTNSSYDGMFRFYDQKQTFAYGLLPSVIKFLEEESIEYDLQLLDQYKIDVSSLDFSSNFVGEERAYQREAIKAIIGERNGIIKIPPRGGKTYTLAEAMRLLINIYQKKGKKEFRGLFVVDTDDLFYQAKRDFSVVLNCDESEIGEIKESTFDVKAITIATIQTLQSILRPKVKKEGIDFRKHLLNSYYETLDFLAADEIQGFVTDGRLKCLPQNTYFRIGMSGTPGDTKFEKFTLYDFFGMIIYNVSERKLISQNVLVKNFVFLFTVDKVKYHRERLDEINKKLKKSKATNFIKEYNKKIAYNDFRNNMITLIAYAFQQRGFRVLILCSRIGHGNDILKRFLSADIECTFISGKDSREYKNDATTGFLQSEKGSILIASDIFKKGKTLPQANVLINAASQTKESVVIQRRGRVLGASQGKDYAIICDFDDQLKRTTQQHSQHRIAVYESLAHKKSVEKIFRIDYNKCDLCDEIIKTLKTIEDGIDES